jgi:peptide-methionine (S)-S-oxide reductase
MPYRREKIVRTLTALGSALTLAGRAIAADAPPSPTRTTQANVASADTGLAKATFAGGCFWCMEPPFDELDGVISTTSGYTGGHEKDPSYEEVSDGITGHAEAVEIAYDPRRISYERLLEVFWRNVDPTVRDRQFCDEGSQYRTAIFYHDAEQKRVAEKSKLELEKSGKLSQPVVTEIVEATTFYPAEEYHQDYYRKNPVRYKYYRWGCKRDQRLRELWGDS